MDVHPTKNASDQELKHWANLMGKQKPENLFDDDVIRCLTKFKATTGDILKATVPQSVVCAQSSTQTMDQEVMADQRRLLQARSMPGGVRP